MMTHAITLSKEDVEEIYPGLIPTLGIRPADNVKFVNLSEGSGKLGKNGWAFYTSDSPAVNAELVCIPYVDGEPQVAARRIRKIHASNREQFEISAWDLDWRGYYFLLMVKDCHNLYSVAEGRRENYSPEVRLAFTGICGKDYLMNGFRGEWNEKMGCYILPLKEVQAQLGEPLFHLITGLAKIGTNGTWYDYGHNYNIATASLTVGDYSYAVRHNSYSDYLEISVIKKLDSTNIETIMIGFNYKMNSFIYSWTTSTI